MIIFEDPHSRELLRQALKEGLVEYPWSDREPRDDRYLRRVIFDHPIDLNAKHEALWHLLLHGPAILPPLDNLKLDPLVKEGIVDETSSQGRSFDFQVPSHVIARLFSPIITYDLIQTRGLRVREALVDEYAELVESDLYFHFSMLETKYRSWESYDDGVAKWRDLLASTRVPGRSPKSKSEIDQAVLSFMAENPVEEFDYYSERRDDVAAIIAIHDRASYWIRLLGASHGLQAPVLAEIKPLASPGELSLTGESGFVAIQIWLDSLTVRPRLETIEDVLRLRKDPLFEDWRAIMTDWMLYLSSGQPELAEKMRAELEKCHNALRGWKAVDHVDGVMTVQSMGADVAQVALDAGLPGFSLVSPLAKGARALATRKYRWVLFGTRM